MIAPGMYTKSFFPCNDCQGQGTIIQKEFLCKSCKGNLVVDETARIFVAVEPGVPNNH